MFFAGLAPALVAMVARMKVREPERWRQAKAEGARRLTIWDLFTPEHRRDTLVGSALLLMVSGMLVWEGRGGDLGAFHVLLGLVLALSLWIIAGVENIVEQKDG
jgi:uncharacterized membrane protein YesL